MTDCIFCRMANGELKPDIVYTSDALIAFRDINPQAPVHILIIPRKHVATLNDLTAADAGLVAEMFMAAKAIAKEEGIDADGYRTVMNCNAGAGQTVFHLHLHLLGGRRMQWPPG